MIEERRSLRRLRQDLERVRLLCELMRKREQRKRELILAHKDIIELKCYPFKYFLKALLTSLKEIGKFENTQILYFDEKFNRFRYIFP